MPATRTNWRAITWLRLAAPLGVVLAGSGCAGGLGTVSKSSPLPAAVAFHPGATVAVTLAAEPAVVSCDALSNRLGHYDEGAEDGMRALARSAGSGEGAVLAFGLLPVAAVVGAVAEGCRVVPPAEMQTMAERLEGSLRAASAPGEFRHCFFQVAEGRTALNFVRSELPWAECVRPAEWLMELGVTQMKLQRAGCGDGCAMVIATRVRLIRASDGQAVYSDVVRFTGEPALPVDWVAERGQPVRRAAEYGYRTIAEQIVQQVATATLR